MITFVRGDLFKTTCEAVVNPCNCVGVAGRGLSLHFKELAPKNYDTYRDLCQMRMLRPGTCAVVGTGELGPNVKYVINLPTKDHWKDPSKIEYIRSGVADLVSAMKNFSIKSVAVPPLGCGCGMLDWNQVKSVIIEGLEYLGHDGLVFEIYEPYTGV